MAKSREQFLDQFDAILDMRDPDFAEQLREATGAEPGDTIEVMTPQFKRVDGLSVPIPQCSFESLASLPDETLKEIGCQKWDDEESETLWLYPAEWYDHIPDGTPIVDINGLRERFKRGETDDDMRFGALAYGFLKAKARP